MWTVRKGVLGFVGFLIAVLVGVACMPAPAAAPAPAPAPAPGAPAAPMEWKPTKPVQFVIQTNPGGGSDKYARFWISIIDKYGWSPQPFVPVNKPGGGGAVALTFLANQRGDPHFVTPTLNSVITRPLLEKIPVMYPSDDLTPIALMAMDPFLLWTYKGRFENFEEFAQACKQEQLTVAGTGAKQEDEVQFFMLAAAVGCKPFKYIPVKGGGTVAAMLAGKQVDLTVNQPSEGLPHYPDKVVPLVAFAKKRLAVFPDVPTHYEVGIDSEWADLLSLETGLHQHRGVIGPPDMSPEAVKWFEDLFRKVFDSPEWQDFMKKRELVPTFMGAEEYKEFLRGYQKKHLQVIREVLGWELRDDLRPAP